MNWRNHIHQFCETIRHVWPDVCSPLIVYGMRVRFATVNLPKGLKGENDNERMG